MRSTYTRRQAMIAMPWKKVQERSSLLYSLLHNQIFIIVWVVMCIVIGIKLVLSGYDSRKILLHQRQAQEDVAREEARGAKLIEQINDADSQFAQEKRLRDELFLQKEGEIILQPLP